MSIVTLRFIDVDDFLVSFYKKVNHCYKKLLLVINIKTFYVLWTSFHILTAVYSLIKLGCVDLVSVCFFFSFSICVMLNMIPIVDG